MKKGRALYTGLSCKFNKTPDSSEAVGRLLFDT